MQPESPDGPAPPRSQRRVRRGISCRVELGQAPKVARYYSFSETATAPIIDRVPVRLYLSERDPCVCRLQVSCIDQVGILLTLTELLTRHGLDVDTADIAVVGNCVDNRFFVRAPRPTDFADAAEWCAELERSVKQSIAAVAADGWNTSSTALHSPSSSREAALAAAERLAVNPHLLCVSAFQELPSAGRSQRRYRLELKGINQAGLLAYMSMVLALSGFSIRRAHISTKDGHVSDIFEVAASVDDAAKRLHRFLHLPAHAEESPASARFRLMWKGDSPGFFDDESMHEVGEEGPLRVHTLGDMQSGGFAAHSTPPSQCKERLLLPNGDVYEGALVSVPAQAGDASSGCQHRHGYGVYMYADDKALYLRYSGQWEKNAKHGFGTLLLRDGSAYVGQWKDNQRHGAGVMFGYGPNGAPGQAAMPTYRYEGEWQCDKPDGIGVQESEDSLYFGRFLNGAFNGHGLKSHLRKPGVAGCSVLCEGQWRPLPELLAEDPTSLRARQGRAHPVQAALAAASAASSASRLGPAAAVEDLESAPAAQTVHFGTSGARASRPGLSSISFGDASGDAAASTGGSSLGGAPERPWPSAAEEGEGEVDIRMTVSPACAIGEGRGASSASASTADIATPLLGCSYPGGQASARAAPGSPPRPQAAPQSTRASPTLPQLVEPLQRMASATALLQTIGDPCSNTSPLQRATSGASSSAMEAAPSAGATQASPTGATRRARTPEGRSDAHVIACPMLWSEKELATVVACLGVAPSAVRRLLGSGGAPADAPGGFATFGSEEPLRVGGASQLIEMTNAQLSQELGLTAPMERMVLRRALGHLLEADRRANSHHGRGLRDVMENPALRKFVIPLERLTLENTICQGGFGIVYRGVLADPGPKDTGPRSGTPRAGGSGPQVVAVKEMLGDHRVRLHELLKEANVMASLKHTNICRFIGVCADGNPKGKRFILSELLHCSLFDLVHRPTRVPYTGDLDIPLILKLCEGICAGLSYIHERSLVHADLKSSNILIDLALRPEDDYKPVPRICDFGHAAVRISSSPHDRLCTPHWAAPEVLRNEGLGPAADMFSVGVLLWEMLAKQVPHHDLGFGQVLATVGWAGTVPDMEQLPAGLPDDIRRLLDELLSFIPLERPSSREGHRRLVRLPRILRGRSLQALLGFVGC